MAASPSQLEINAAIRNGLAKLSRALLKKGIRSGYRRSVLTVYGANVEWAEYRLLRASNGECALYPRVKYKEGAALPEADVGAGNLGESKSTPGVYEGWDAFDKIEKEA